MRRFAHLSAAAAIAAALLPALAGFDPVQAPASMSSIEGLTGVNGMTAQHAAGPAAKGSRESKGSEDPPVVVDDVSPRSAKTSSTLDISGRVTNTTETKLSKVKVRLRFSGYPLDTRSELDAYAKGRGAQPSETAKTVTLKDPVKPGGSGRYSLSTPAKDLRLDDSGVYPIAVEALTEDGDDLGTQRTFLPFQAGGSSPKPVDVAWLWPLMDRPLRADDNTYLRGDLPKSVEPGGRLGTLLRTGAQDDSVTLDPEDGTPTPTPSESPGADGEQDADTGGEDEGAVPITWAVDPGLLDDVKHLTKGQYKVVTESPTDPDATTPPRTETRGHSEQADLWLRQAKATTGDDPLVSTPYANPDIPALLGNDLRNDAEDARTIGENTLESILDRSADDSVAWPPGGLLNKATRDFYTSAGASRFILDDSAMPRQPWVDHTPTAQAELPGDADALVADSGLTEVLGADSRGPGKSALAAQRFAAETEMISAERAKGDRTIVAAPPQNWNPDADFATSVLEDTKDLPWLKPVSLDDVKGPKKGDSERQDLRDPRNGGELSGDYLDGVKKVRKDLRLFNSILTDTDNDDPYRPAILRLESAGWREEEAAASRVRAMVGQSVQDSMEMVRIIPTEPVTLASKEGKIGVPVANDTNQRVRVTLSMFSENTERLSIGRYKPTMEIGPKGKTTVYVPLRARTNGRTVLHMSLQNTTGEPLPAEETRTPVTATDLGNQALIISAAGALVLVVALVPRALRKWRRRRAADAIQHKEPDADDN